MSVRKRPGNPGCPSSFSFYVLPGEALCFGSSTYTPDRTACLEVEVSPEALTPAVMKAWFIRSVETWLFLWLVGADVPLVAAMVVETALILVRAAAVPVPAGLGVQDAGYVLCLRALGVPDATTLGAAFVVIKRGKDLFWIVVGFVLLGLGRRKGEPVLGGIPTLGSGLES